MSRDPGLQAERTALAWRRTTLGVTVVAVLAVRMALSRGAAGVLPAAAAMAGWAGFVMVAYRRVAMMTPRRPAVAGRVLPLSALVAVGYAGLGVLLVLTSLG